MVSGVIIWVTNCLIFAAIFHPICGNPPPPAPEPPHCYVCKSDKDSKCTPSKPSGEAIPAKNCDDPNKLFKEWLGGQEFMKLGIGSFNFQKLMGLGTDKAGEKTENVTACVYLYISDENAVTSGIDKGIQKARSFIPGDKGASDSVTVKKWIFRDCITVVMGNEEAKKEGTLDKCVPLDTGGTGKAHFCTCRQDKCNEPLGNLMGYLKGRSLGDDDDSKAVKVKGDKGIQVLIALALVAALANI